LFEHLWFVGYSIPVNRLKPFVTVIVLALWASCVIRCEAVKLGSAAALFCCGEPSDDCGGQPASTDHCVCSWVKSGGYISEQTSVSIPHPMDLSFVTSFVELQVHPPQIHSVEVKFYPPELLTSWQFSFRTALSPRAPSLVS
jgi:hypothetical protein